MYKRTLEFNQQTKEVLEKKVQLLIEAANDDDGEAAEHHRNGLLNYIKLMVRTAYNLGVKDSETVKEMIHGIRLPKLQDEEGAERSTGKGRKGDL